jgi:thiamine biosynthesis lipoprotein
MASARRQTLRVALAAGVLLLAGGGLWYVGWRHQARSVGPLKVMGTEARGTAVSRGWHAERAQEALSSAEAALRGVESRMSWRVETSDVGRLNAAKAGDVVAVTPETLEVLRSAEGMWRRTGGAFDVTCKPVIDLWLKARETHERPGHSALAAARAASSWDDFELRREAVLKKRDGATVDLGGIAKGFAVDRAVAALKNAEVLGGLVDVGGDVRCFGRPPDGEAWRVDVRSPFRAATFVRLALNGDWAVCTSGNYERYALIGTERYSHIVDPRPDAPNALAALPAASSPASVTVIAPTATSADAWATALSVLGPAGIDLLPKGRRIEVMIVTGGPDDFELHTTEGFKRFVTGPLPGRAAAP